MHAEPDPPKAVKKRKKSKLDSEGNKPEVSVYAKAYNKVKAQFVRIRYSVVPSLLFAHRMQPKVCNVLEEYMLCVHFLLTGG